MKRAEPAKPVKRKKRRREPGWLSFVRFVLVMALVALPFVLATPTVGYVLGHVSDVVGVVIARLR